MSQKNSPLTQSATQFFGLHYPPFADTFEVHQPFCSLDLCSLMHDAKTRKTAAVLILVGQPMLKKCWTLDYGCNFSRR